MEAERNTQKQEMESVTIPTDKEALAELLYGNESLRELLKGATEQAEGRIYRENRDREYQRVEAERVANVQGWLDEMEIDGLKVGEPQGAISRSSFTYGMYQNGNYIGNIENKPLSPMTKDDVRLAVLRNKDKFQ